MEEIINLNKNNISDEHICCAISDKKCKESYELKKKWLSQEFDNGYVFRRINARAKVFIEYGPVEKGWVPINADNYLLVNCFWVSGKYKGNGYGKELLSLAIEDAKSQGKAGLVTVVGNKKFHFMSDGKWLMKQGFEVCDSLPSGFNLLEYRIANSQKKPTFKDTVRSAKCTDNHGVVAYYSNRCPFSEYHVKTSLTETARKRGIPLEIVKLETMENAQSAPTPATIFSLFYKGDFVTTDISVCMDSRFDKILGKMTK